MLNSFLLSFLQNNYNPLQNICNQFSKSCKVGLLRNVLFNIQAPMQYFLFWMDDWVEGYKCTKFRDPKNFLIS